MSNPAPVQSSIKGRPITIFSGRTNPALANSIAQYFGQALSKVTIKQFSDGEIYVKYEESIRGTDVYIIQSTYPPGDNWIELFMLIDAAKRASAHQITAVMPYFGYARQDRKDKPRVSIAAKMCVNMLETVGVDRILTMDLHAPQLQGFCDVPVDHLYGSKLFIEHLRQRAIPNLVVVAPDVGASKRARAYAERLQCDMALIDKRRPEANVAEVMHIIGNVDRKNVLLVDDMIDTAGTLVSGAEALRNAGALTIYACGTHPILSGPAYDHIESSPIDKVIVTDSIPLKRKSEKIQVLSVAPYFADAIHRIHTNASISTLFEE